MQSTASTKPAPGATPSREANTSGKAERLREHRLHNNAQFRRIYENGQKVQMAHFVAFCLRRVPSPPEAEPADAESSEAQPPKVPLAPGPRIGFTLPRAVGNAVVRNRIRRRFREIFQARLSSITKDWEIVINPRRKALDAPIELLRRDVDNLVQRCSK